jgi:hypothetical protein
MYWKTCSSTGRGLFLQTQALPHTVTCLTPSCVRSVSRPTRPPAPSTPDIAVEPQTRGIETRCQRASQMQATHVQDQQVLKTLLSTALSAKQYLTVPEYTEDRQHGVGTGFWRGAGFRHGDEQGKHTSHLHGRTCLSAQHLWTTLTVWIPKDTNAMPRLLGYIFLLSGLVILHASILAVAIQLTYRELSRFAGVSTC